MTEKIVPLKDLIVNRKSGVSPTKEGGTPVKFVSRKLIKDGTVNTEGIEIQNVKGKISENLLAEGDVIFCLTGNFRCALVPKEAEGCSFNSFFVALTPDTTKISSQELYDCLRQESVLQAIRGVARGTAFPHITIKDMLELELPLPEKK